MPKYFAAENFRDADPALAAEAELFREHGYLIVDLLTDLPPDWFGSIRDEIDRLLAGAHRLGDGWKAGALIRELAVNAEIRARLADLFGRRAFPFQTLNFRHGSQQQPHADHIHFSSLPAHFMCGVWVALEDVDASAGPLVYYPGSHKLPLLDLSDAGTAGNRNIGPEDYGRHYEPLIQKTLDAHGIEPVSFEARRGQAIIWAANLIHGGAERQSPTATRYSQITHYYFDDCAYYTPMKSDLARVAPVRDGRPCPVGPRARLEEWVKDTFLKRRVARFDG